jgi:hypothetical protein
MRPEQEKPKKPEKTPESGVGEADGDFWELFRPVFERDPIESLVENYCLGEGQEYQRQRDPDSKDFCHVFYPPHPAEQNRLVEAIRSYLDTLPPVQREAYDLSRKGYRPGRIAHIILHQHPDQEGIDWRSVGKMLREVDRQVRLILSSWAPKSRTVIPDLRDQDPT